MEEVGQEQEQEQDSCKDCWMSAAVSEVLVPSLLNEMVAMSRSGE